MAPVSHRRGNTRQSSRFGGANVRSRQEPPVKITQEEVVERQTVLLIELEDDDLGPYLDRGYRRVVQRILVPGFRKGKAPRWRVEQVVGREGLLNEVLDTMLPEVTERAISEQDLDAAGLPRLELLDISPVSVKATVPLTPNIDLASYADIRIPLAPVEIKQEDVDARLEQLQHSVAAWEPVERPVKMGDLLTMTAVAKVDGRTVMNEEGAVYFLDEDSTRPFPGFSEQLVGLEAGSSKEFGLDLPADFVDETIAGGHIEVAVTASEIKERILPELDDEFAKGIGDGHDSLNALREKIETEVTAEAQEASDRSYRDSVLQALVDSAEVELSPLMIEHEVEHIEGDRTRLLNQLNIRMDDYLRSMGKTAEEMKVEIKDEATGRLQRTFLMTKVAEAEGLDVSDGEIEEKAQEVLNEPRPEGAPPINDGEELRASLKRSLLVDKTIGRLVEIARGESVAGEARQLAPVQSPAEADANEETDSDAAPEGGDVVDPQA